MQYFSVKVKFVNNQCHWYEGSFSLGDLVYTGPPLEGILGKVIDYSTSVLAASGISKKVGHIALENSRSLKNFWDSLDNTKKERVQDYINLEILRFDKQQKYPDILKNTWTIKGSEGMTWDDYLVFLRSIADSDYDKRVITEDKVRFDGYVWEILVSLPPKDRIEVRDLYHGVIYGTKEMLDEVGAEFSLDGLTELKNGIYRARISDPDVMKAFPSCKAAFFTEEHGGHAVLSESGYPYITHHDITCIHPAHGDDMKYEYYPDEIIYVWRGLDYSGEYYLKPDAFNAKLDNLINPLNYIIFREGRIYRMTRVDPDAPPPESNKYWSYIVKDKGIEIIRYKGNSKDVVFPETINGVRVIGIGDRFGGIDDSYKNMETVRIPESYDYIGAYAFCKCRKLREIALPSSMAYIGNGAFLGCSSLGEITLPDLYYDNGSRYDDDPKHSGSMMFYDCKSLYSVKCRPGSFIIDRFDSYELWGRSYGPTIEVL